MRDPNFRKTLIFSLLGHLTFFSLFSFSFGSRFAPADSYQVSFWGSILKNYDFTSRPLPNPKFGKLFPPFLEYLKPKSGIKNTKVDFTISPDHFKPGVDPLFREYKPILTAEAIQKPVLKEKKAPVVLLHPVLPYQFTLYFKDRSAVHIELEFKLIPYGKTGSIEIKRKISSGNLETDLLTMRYISHYLFIQQARLTRQSWQTVKIDFSAKEND
jgi:hypothetical protein